MRQPAGTCGEDGLSGPPSTLDVAFSGLNFGPGRLKAERTEWYGTAGPNLERQPLVRISQDDRTLGFVALTDDDSPASVLLRWAVASVNARLVADHTASRARAHCPLCHRD